MAWKDLSIAQRSQLMNIMRHNGISSLSEMRRLYDLSSPSLSSLGENTFNMQPQAPVYDKGGYLFKDGGKIHIKPENRGKLYEMGGPSGPGDYMYQPKDSLQLPKEVVPETYLSPYGKFKMNGDGSVYVLGLTNVDSDIRNGNAYYYHDWYPNYLTDPKYKYLKNDETGEYFRYEPELNPNLNLTGYTPVSTKDVKASLPKRDYIGGSDYRLNVVKRVPGLLGMIKQKAAAYGVDPNLMLHRFMREGIVDHWTDQYNNQIDASDQKTFFSDALLHQSLNGYGDVGLDDAGSNLQQGLYSLKDSTATWEPYQTVNEQGRDVTSVVVPDMNSALEIQAADMAYRQRELAKRGLVGNAYVNAAYNMGLYNSKLNNPDFVSGKYSVPDYGVFGEGGEIHIKKKNRGKFTALKKRTGHSASWFKAHGTPAQKKMAVFALNARKWKHAHGGIKF